MRNLYHNAAYFLKFRIKHYIQEKTITPDFDEELTLSSEESNSKEENFNIPILPALIPEQTALFTTLTDKSPLHHINEHIYRRKVLDDYNELRSKGYSAFFVNHGTRYGMLAQQVLLSLKKEGHSFELYCGKIWGERKSLLTNNMVELIQCASCDRCYPACHPIDYMKQVYFQVHAIATENQLLYTKGKIPAETFAYYIKIISAH